MNDIAKSRLIFDEPLEPIEIAPSPVLDQRTPELDDLSSGGWRGLAGQPLAYHQSNRFLDGRVRPVGDLVKLSAMQPIIEHGREIARNPRHAPRPDRLDSRLLDGIEHRARLLSARHELAMDRWIMARELERDGIGVAAHNGGVGTAELARWLRQTRLSGRDTWSLGREGHFQIRLSCDRSKASRHRPLERLGRALLYRGFAFDVRRHELRPKSLLLFGSIH